MSKPKQKRQPDSFQIARRIYRRRKALQLQADALLADADPRVAALVESIEEAEADTTDEEGPVSE
jgi:hypothetical protein